HERSSCTLLNAKSTLELLQGDIPEAAFFRGSARAEAHASISQPEGALAVHAGIVQEHVDLISAAFDRHVMDFATADLRRERDWVLNGPLSTPAHVRAQRIGVGLELGRVIG